MKLVVGGSEAALQQAGVSAVDVSHFILAAPFKGVATAVIKKLGITAEAEADGLEADCGYSGAAHGLLMLAHVLERAAPNQTIVLAGFGQGVDVLVLRTTDALKSFTPRHGVSGALADAQNNDTYLRLASYENAIDLEWGMRGEKSIKTALTEQYRSSDRVRPASSPAAAALATLYSSRNCLTA